MSSGKWCPFCLGLNVLIWGMVSNPNRANFKGGKKGNHPFPDHSVRGHWAAGMGGNWHVRNRQQHSWAAFQRPRITSLAVQGHISLKTFPSSMNTLFCSHPNAKNVIITKFCTCHNSCAVVAHAKVCSDQIANDEIMAKNIFHQIWFMMEKLSVKWARKLVLKYQQIKYHIYKTSFKYIYCALQTITSCHNNFMPFYMCPKALSNMEYRTQTDKVQNVVIYFNSRIPHL